jgi:hypothetical protein
MNLFVIAGISGLKVLFTKTTLRLAIKQCAANGCSSRGDALRGFRPAAESSGQRQ